MSILDSMKIGSEGLSVHSQRLKTHASNVANMDTPNYSRKIPVLYAQEDVSFESALNQVKENIFTSGFPANKAGGVSFAGTIEDSTPGVRMYAPGHPDADKNGFIRRSNVNAMVDMADALMSQRAYEASMAVISISKAMAQKANEITRGG